MNTQQALSIALCAINHLLYEQPINCISGQTSMVVGPKMNQADLTQAAVILAQMGATLRPVIEVKQKHNPFKKLSDHMADMVMPEMR